jgi:hypothetical protein
LTIDIILQQFVYPIKDVTGEWYCYVSRYFETYCFYIYLSNSFFINFYRYMCVVHSNFLRNWSINIRVIIFERNSLVLRQCMILILWCRMLPM